MLVLTQPETFEDIDLAIHLLLPMHGISNEGFVSSGVISNILRGIGNITLGFMNDFLSTVHMFRSFSRSEYGLWRDNNYVTDTKIRHLEYSRIKDTKITFPYGMKADKLVPTSSALLAFFGAADIQNKLKECNIVIKELLTLYRSGLKSQVPVSGSSAMFAASYVRNVTNQYTAIEKAFTSTTDQNYSAPFSAAFANMRAFNEVLDNMLKYTDHYRMVKGVIAEVEYTTEMFNEIISIIKTNSDSLKITAQDLKQMSDTAKTAANLVSQYGECIRWAHTIEHNMMTVVNSLI